MTIKIDETVNAPGPREALPIKATAVSLNRASHCNREWFVHLDDTTTLQDATSSKPELWRLVQKNRDKAMSEGDEVRLIWPDQIAVASLVTRTANKSFFCGQIFLVGGRGTALLGRMPISRSGPSKVLGRTSAKPPGLV
jgi:hypothetical protein